MATKKYELDLDTIGDVVGTVAVAAIVYRFFGGEALAFLDEWIALIGAGAAAFFCWKLVRKNN